MENKTTYTDIENANKTLKGTDIKGKKYIEVNERVKAFRMVYPDGCIMTEITSNVNGVCHCRAYVYAYYLEEPSDINSKGITAKLLGTGSAYEKEDSTFINKTSYIENCETSAVGRALGMCGFGIDTSVASADEVQTAIINQEQQKKQPKQKQTIKATPQQLEIIKTLEVDLVKMFEYYKVSKLEDLTLEQANEIIKMKGNK